MDETIETNRSMKSQRIDNLFAFKHTFTNGDTAIVYAYDPSVDGTTDAIRMNTKWGFEYGDDISPSLVVERFDSQEEAEDAMNNHAARWPAKWDTSDPEDT